MREETGVRIAVSGRTDAGGARRINEDAFVIADLTHRRRPGREENADLEVTEAGVLVAVSDGIGGAAAGAVASSLAVASLAESLAFDADPDDPASLDRGFARAHRTVRRAGEAPGRRGMGATLVAAVVLPARAYVACVGDSRAYLVRGACAVPLTADQNYAQALVEAGVMTPAQAAGSSHRRWLLQAVGLGDAVVPAIARVELRRGDALALCSDGLTASVSDREIARELAATPDPGTAAARLVALALARGGTDDATVVLARVDGERLPKAGVLEDPLASVTRVREFDFAAAARSAEPGAAEEGPDGRAGPGGLWRRAARSGALARVAAAVVALLEVLTDSLPF